MTSRCGVVLLEQHSHKPCTAGVTFGCVDRHTFWSSCRGQFRCGTKTSTRPCGYPPGAALYKCSCRSDARPALPFQRSACAFSRDAPSPDPIALRRSLAAPGADARWRATFAKLDAGRPLTLAVFGASVAQNAGCTAQPDKRCFKYGPHANVHGFAVQLLEHLNRSWPHESHDSERRPRCDAAERRNPLFVHARPARIARCGHRRVGLDGSVHEGRPSLLDDREPRAAAPLPWPRTRDHLALDQRLVQGRRS